MTKTKNGIRIVNIDKFIKGSIEEKERLAKLKEERLREEKIERRRNLKMSRLSAIRNKLESGNVGDVFGISEILYLIHNGESVRMEYIKDEELDYIKEILGVDFYYNLGIIKIHSKPKELKRQLIGNKPIY